MENNFRYTYNKLVRDKIPENIDSEVGRKIILETLKYEIRYNNRYT